MSETPTCPICGHEHKCAPESIWKDGSVVVPVHRIRDLERKNAELRDREEKLLEQVALIVGLEYVDITTGAMLARLEGHMDALRARIDALEPDNHDDKSTGDSYFDAGGYC